jgi:tRNA U34 5-carboxymethylaminomethyl modifying enzyme MnmG/GidA
LLIDEVKQLIIDKRAVTGVRCVKTGIIKSKKVIITAGTYLNACVHIGNIKHNEGPQHFERSN